MTDTITIPRALLEQALPLQMTLRDYFAAKAMQTLLGSEYTSEHGLHEGWMGAIAHESYMLADSMLKAKPVEQAEPVAWLYSVPGHRSSASCERIPLDMTPRGTAEAPLYLHPPTPAWHDAPEVATLKAERDAAMKDAERYRWLAAHTRISSEHWGGRWSIVIDGPVPKRNDCEDAFDEAIDSAIAKMERDTAR